MDGHQDDRGDMGRHAGNRLCNYCGKAEGERLGGADPDARVRLLIDLEEYSDEERVFQGKRSPENPLPHYLVWCVDCAGSMLEDDPITHFREPGFPDNSPEGPYGSLLSRRRGGLPKSPPPRQ